jgi:redox-sensitive bicupin YhaK (pirin superfamily)
MVTDSKSGGPRRFGTHPHRDMEIISYVLEGGLKPSDEQKTFRSQRRASTGMT